MFGARAAVVSAMLLVAGALAVGEPRGSTAPLTITRHFTPADRVTGRYQYVPFDVPGGTETLRITYQYDRATGANVVDLGLFEPGPLDLGTRAFRGYSGGSKSEVTISAAETTPGYRPGPLPAGRWHVLLGLYKVRDSGVDVTVTVETRLDVDARTPMDKLDRLRQGYGESAEALRAKAKGLSRLTPDPAGARWLMGALHAHTLHSDGTVTPAELMRLAREAQFDFVAITDHNNTTHTYDPSLENMEREVRLKADTTGPLLEGPLRIVGEEVTTPGGHANVWGLKPGHWVDFRVSPEDKRIGELVAAARRLGGLFSINHPASECVGCGWDHDVVEGIEAIEIFNGRHGEVEKALAIWDRLLVAGRKITGVGSSDWHTAPNPLDVANVRVFAESLTEQAILSAIRGGRVIVMGRGRDDTPEVVVRAGNTAARGGESLTVAAAAPITVEVSAPGLRGGHGTLVVVANGKRAAPVSLDAFGRITIQERADHGYMRFELYAAAAGSLFAATNPVYLVRP